MIDALAERPMTHSFSPRTARVAAASGFHFTPKTVLQSDSAFPNSTRLGDKRSGFRRLFK